jgi:DNA-directed RNA polymerase specialized sigma24 family protein
MQTDRLFSNLGKCGVAVIGTCIFFLLASSREFSTTVAAWLLAAGTLLALLQSRTLSPQELLRWCAAIPPAEAAWREFEKRYQQGLAAGICRVIGYPPSAKYQELFPDVLQNVYARLLDHDRRALLAFRGHSEGEAQSYLRRIAVSVALNEVRRRRIAVPMPEDPLFEPPSEDSFLKNLLNSISLDEVLARELRGRNKDRNILAFKMHVYEGCSAAEIAGVLGMGVTARAVENQISRMRSRLQKIRQLIE